MNKKRREKIANITFEIEKIKSDLIEKIKSDLEDIKLDEEIAFDNMPENLQYSMRGEESQDAIDTLDTANDLVQEALDSLESAIDELNNI